MRLRSFVLLVLALGAGGCKSAATRLAERPAVARFFLETTAERAVNVVLPRSAVRIALSPQPVITEGDIADVALAQVDLGKCLAFRVTPAAVRDLYRLTGANQGRRLVLMINDDPIGARRIDGAIADGVLFVFVELPDDALPKLVADLKSTTLVVQQENARK